MRIPLLAAILLCTAVLRGQACHYGQGESGLDADLKALRAEPSCQSAFALYQKCLWGSSADPPRADVVQQKCLGALRSKLTPTQKTILHDKLELCALTYGGMEGTLSLSEESSCGLQVYVDFATDPAKASQPIPRASFNCTRAQTPLERAVCSDRELGRYDLLMARAYESFLGELKAEGKPRLVKSQRAWNAATRGACSVTSAEATPAAVSCLRKCYRERMQTLNGCADAADIGCLDTATAP